MPGSLRRAAALLLLLVPAASAAQSQAALVEHDGVVYVGTEEGLHRRSEDGRLARVGAPVAVTALASGASLWVGTAKGLFRLDRDALVEIPPPIGRDPRVVALAAGPQGEVWASFSGTLLRRGGGSWRPAGPDTGLVTALFTRGADVWIGTTAGAYRGARRLFAGPVRAIAAMGQRGPVVFLGPDGSIRSETGAELLAAGYGVRGVVTGGAYLWAYDGAGAMRGFSTDPDGDFAARAEGEAGGPIRALLSGRGRLLAVTPEGVKTIVPSVPSADAPAPPSEEPAPRRVSSPFAFVLDAIYSRIPSFGHGVEEGLLLGLGIGAGLLCLGFVWIFVRHTKKGKSRVVVVSRHSRTRPSNVLPKDLPLEVAGAVTKYRLLVERINEVSVAVTAGEIDDAIETEIRELQAESAQTEKILRELLARHAEDSRIAGLLREALGEKAR